MLENRWRTCSAFLLLSCASLPIHGCFLAFYPDTYDASDFEEFQYRVESDPPCMERPSTSEEYPDTSYGPVCEATITRQASGEYVVLLGVRTDYQSDSPYLPQRTLTESEADRMLLLFGELRINMHPQPFCDLPILGSLDGETLLQWDEFELVINDCDKARLDVHQVFTIGWFLNNLVPGPVNGSAETTE